MPEKINSKTIRSRIKALRSRMKRSGMDICLITSDDWHQSEYSGDFFAVREFFSGFTGSAGSLVITMNDAALFTDGRYFVQADYQLEGTDIRLMKSGTEGVPAVSGYIEILAGILGEKDKKIVLGLDGRTISSGLGEKLLKTGRIELISDFDPADEIWEDRPEFPHSRPFILGEEYTGRSLQNKLAAIREEMDKSGADAHVTASLDDIAWILNMRGRDVECNPVFMSFLLIKNNGGVLFANEESIDPEVREYLAENKLELKPYENIYDECKKLAVTGNKILIDKERVNYRLFSTICEAGGDEAIKEAVNPSLLMKAIKNETEIKNLIDIHIEDGLAVTRLMHWVKTADRSDMTEMKAAEYVDSLRSRISDYYDLSFPTISAYGANAAMMHYAATEDNQAKIGDLGMLLVDSGGQYLRGTTDITRTFACGKVSDEEKRAFTLTLKGMLALANVTFLKGCSGYSLDILARAPLWEQGIDYRSGTGHGVGYMLNVHESPNAFRWRYTPGVSEYAALEPGMVTTDEPGVYMDGKFGLRIENELLCEEAFVNEYGTFLKFRVLTMAPIDLDLVDTRYLEVSDIKRLNEYHKQVYDALSPLMNGEELEFLRKYTKPVGR